MSASQLSVLNLLLERAGAERDAALGDLRAALGQAQAARAQAGQLLDYRHGYRERWTQNFSQRTTMEIVGCYQSFGQRLDHAVDSQGHIAAHADQRVERARSALAAAELRVASIRKLIERRQLEAQHARQRQEQHANDEFAARVHASRSAAASLHLG